MRLDEEKFLLHRTLSEYTSIFPNGSSYLDFIDAVRNGSILLEITEKETSKVIDSNCIDEIKKTIPFLQRIVDNPRSFITTKEEKTPVEIAKRINCKAISKLSRDSNDWRARTFLSVIPKNITSDINEETLNIYENRMIKTLIDRVLFYVSKRKQYIEELLNKLQVEMATLSIENDLQAYVVYRNNSNELMKTLARQTLASSREPYQVLKEQLNDVDKIESKLNALKMSDFYRALRRTRRVENPLQKSNIFMFDQNYKAAYQLWNYLNLNILDEDVSIIEEESESLPQLYNFYCFEMLLASVFDMGFSEINNGGFNLVDNQLVISCPFVFSRGNAKFKIWKDNADIILEFLIDEDQEKWEKIKLHTCFDDVENKNRIEIDSWTKSIMDDLLPKNKFFPYDACFSLVDVDVHYCSKQTDFGEKIYRRLFNIGDNYSDQEESVEKYSGYKTGMLVISPMDLRANFLRLQRLIYSRILRINMLSDMSTCPLCGSEHIKKRGANDYVCHSCKHSISLSSCSSCNQSMLWIKYSNDDILKKDEIIQTIENKPYYYQIKNFEAVMGVYAITSFTLEKESNVWKLKSLCPHCGKQLGQS